MAATLALHLHREDVYFDEVRSSLGTPYPDKTSVLFYDHDQNELQIWLVNQDGIQAYHQRDISEAQLRASIRQVRQASGIASQQIARLPQRLTRGIAVVPREVETIVSLEQALETLTALLLPETIVEALANTQHLIVVPVFEIGTVPYAMLQPFEDDSLMIHSMSITVAASLHDLGSWVFPWHVEYSFTSPLVVGNPLLPPSSSWAVPPLPGAEDEAQAVAELMATEPLIAAAATKEAALAQVEQSSFIYVATHGVADERDPLEQGFLMFAAPTLEQGWWTAREIPNTRLDAQMAVLSACQTGLGGVHDAGVIGVARAFQIAGVPRVVMSLWNVNDASTSELMQAFVRHLTNEVIPAEALRLAMLETRETYPNPADWAAFVLFGSPR